MHIDELTNPLLCLADLQNSASFFSKRDHVLLGLDGIDRLDDTRKIDCDDHV